MTTVFETEAAIQAAREIERIAQASRDTNGCMADWTDPDTDTDTALRDWCAFAVICVCCFIAARYIVAWLMDV